jgi:hypothetical protein
MCSFSDKTFELLNTGKTELLLEELFDLLRLISKAANRDIAGRLERLAHELGHKN